MATIKPIEGRSVHQIQSGQVIVDLCSVVKELVENSLDAGGTAITVTFKQQGLDAIEVQDNGAGIAPDDYATLALKHYTSKLDSYDDLAKLETFGFRGEALSSLCAVSKLHVVTARDGEAPKGTRLDFEQSGKLASKTIAACTKGTTIAVEKLFHNLPVRRRELEKNIKREYGKVIGLLHAYACVCTNVRLSVTNQTKGKKTVVFGTRGNAATRDNIANVFGVKTISALLPLALTLELQPTAPGSALAQQRDSVSRAVQVQGHISKPVFGEGRAAPDRQMFFVNSRPCALPQISKAFNEVYKSYNITQSPFIFANMVLDTGAYDVNVSPDKRTIMLHDQGALIESLKASLVELFDGAEQTVPVSQIPRAGLLRSSGLGGGGGESTSPMLSLAGRGREAAESAGGSALAYEERGGQDDDDAAGKGGDTLESHSSADAHDAPGLGEGMRAKPIDLTSLRGPKSTSTGPTPDNHESLAKRLADAHARELGQTSPDADEQQPSSDTPDQRGSATPHLPRPVQDFDARNSSQMEKTRAAATNKQVVESLRRYPGFRSSKEVLESEQGDDEDEAAEAYRPKPSLYTPANRRLRVKVFPASTGGEAAAQRSLRGLHRFAAPTTAAAAAAAAAAASLDEDGDASGLSDEDAVSQIEDSEAEDEEEESGEEGEDVGEEVSGKDIQQSDPDDDIDDEAADEQDEFEDEQDADDDQTRRTNEQARIQAIISQAEANGIPATSETKRRATNILRSFPSKHRNSVLNTTAVLHTSLPDLVSASHALLLQQSTTAAATQPQQQAQHTDPTTLSKKSEEERLSLIISKSDFASMRIIGQFNLGFILALRGATDLFIIDQHASDEIFNFSRLYVSTALTPQPLVHPRTLDLTAVEEEVILAHKDTTLVKNGFNIRVDTSGAAAVGRRCKLLTLPTSRETVFDFADLEELLGKLIDAPAPSSALSSGGEDGQQQQQQQQTTFDLQRLHETGVIRPDKVRRMLAMRACRSSIMVGKPLSRAGMQKVVRHMGEIARPWNCPHGRPTMRHLGNVGEWKGWTETDGLMDERLDEAPSLRAGEKSVWDLGGRVDWGAWVASRGEGQG